MKRHLRNAIVVALWLAATVATIKIVTSGAGKSTDEAYWVINTIGVLAVISSSLSLLWAMGHWHRGKYIAFAGCIAIWVVANAFVFPNEVSFWSAHITRMMHRQQDLQAAADDHRGALSRVRAAVKTTKPEKSAKEIEFIIDAALAKAIAVGREKKSLSVLTAACTDKESPHYKLCGEIQNLRADAERARRFEAKEDLLWHEATNVSEPVDSADAHGVYDGMAWLSRQSATTTPDIWTDRVMITGVILLMFLRDWMLYVGLVDKDEHQQGGGRKRFSIRRLFAKAEEEKGPVVDNVIQLFPDKPEGEAVASLALSAEEEEEDPLKKHPLVEIVDEAVNLIGPRVAKYSEIKAKVVTLANSYGWAEAPRDNVIGTALRERSHPSWRERTKRKHKWYDLSQGGGFAQANVA